MKALGSILVYLAATVLIGALLAPPLYWMARSVAHELPEGRIATFLATTEFHRFLDRSVLLAAVVLLWPLLSVAHLENFWKDLGLRRDWYWRRHLLGGFLAGFISLLLLGGILVLCGVCHPRGDVPFGKLAWLPIVAATVAMFEEWFFRGVIMGAVRRTTVDSFAIVAVALLFAAVHFLKPPASPLPQAGVTWWSGLELLPSAFWQFSQPLLLLGGFGTLFLMGLVLGYARWRTRSLWMPIGLHAGLITGKMGFLKVTHQHGPAWPWVGPNMVIGLAPILVLLVIWGLVWWMLRDEFP